MNRARFLTSSAKSIPQSSDSVVREMATVVQSMSNTILGLETMVGGPVCVRSPQGEGKLLVEVQIDGLQLRLEAVNGYRERQSSGDEAGTHAASKGGLLWGKKCSPTMYNTRKATFQG
ncbi:hypothetical protein Y032_0649g1124 [Ancylostoma ceylanicum]|uniref:Uncharacterized protein n=1 Tax=Ancylostoma ceylanicum TaxID=53326 RepID=A0A016WKT1_9BILA|nr:hypothetical protein Y032_0649g1124 [Ancylostoma ceylanicum]